MSERALAETLDLLAGQGQGYLTETAETVTMSGLSGANTRLIVNGCSILGWPTSVFDSESTPSDNDINEAFAPYRILLDKPPAPEGVIRLLTNEAFAQWLDRVGTSSRLQVARLVTPIRTRGATYMPWSEELPPPEFNAAKSPRSLVREFTNARLVPVDIRPWLLDGEYSEQKEDPAFVVWADRSLNALAHSIPDEIDSQDSALKFRGPPRLSLKPVGEAAGAFSQIGFTKFVALQEAVSWIYENEQDAETRRVLFATEIAHSGNVNTEAVDCLGFNAAAALDGARIAYQLSLSDLSRDSLKVLGDLRKAVNEEIGKLTEQNRQLVNSIASAIAIGAGLLAAKITTPINAWLLIAVMAISATYVLIVAGSGYQFIRLQRNVRADWRPRLYRFLPQADYDRMVGSAIGRAEQAFCLWAVIGSLAMMALIAVVVWASVLNGVKASPPSEKSSARVEQGVQPSATPQPSMSGQNKR